MNIIDKIKLLFVAWNPKKFLHKYTREGVKIFLAFVLGHIGADKLVQAGVEINQDVLASVLDGAFWTGIYWAANVVKMKAKENKAWNWLSSLL